MGSEMKAKELIQFEELCQEAKNACNSDYSSDHFEPYFLRVLEHIRLHPELQTEITATLVQMLSDDDKGPWELIPFCMHELRWPEVHVAAQERLRNESDHRIKSIMAKVLESFSDGWSDADIYSYYRKPKS